VASPARGGLHRGQVLAGNRGPAHVEVLRDVGDDRAAQPRPGVVPAEAAASGVLRRVPAIAAQVGEIDAADEGDLVVDHDELLVVAVQEALAIVERDADIGVARELPRVGSDLGTGRREEVERRAGPEQHAHVDASRGGLGAVPRRRCLPAPRRTVVRGLQRVEPPEAP
jgi:hypothetical protein